MSVELIRVRPLESVDLEKRVKWINDKTINKFLNFDVPISLASTVAWFSRSVLDPSKRNFSVTVGDAEILVGMCGLLNIDLRNRSAELYVTIGEVEYQGRGVARAAVREMLLFGFANLGLNRIWLTTLSENIRAQSLYESMGFVREGILRDYTYRRGEYDSVFIYSYLASDFS